MYTPSLILAISKRKLTLTLCQSNNVRSQDSFSIKISIFLFCFLKKRIKCQSPNLTLLVYHSLKFNRNNDSYIII